MIYHSSMSLTKHKALEAQRERIKQLKLRNEILATKKEETLWKWFSYYVRLKDCVDGGFGECISCGKYIYFKDGDAGHYIPQKNHYSVLYDEMNVHLQCVSCNQHGSGEVAKYRIRIIEKYGLEAVEDLERRSKIITKRMPLWEVQEKSAKYRQLAKDEAFRNGVEIK